MNEYEEKMLQQMKELNNNLFNTNLQLKSLSNIDKKLYKLNWLIENKLLKVKALQK